MDLQNTVIKKHSTELLRSAAVTIRGSSITKWERVRTDMPDVSALRLTNFNYTKNIPRRISSGVKYCIIFVVFFCVAFRVA